MWSLRVWKNAWPGSRIVPVPMLFCQSNYWALWTDGALSDRETALRVGFFASLRMTRRSGRCWKAGRFCGPAVRARSLHARRTIAVQLGPFTGLKRPHVVPDEGGTIRVRACPELRSFPSDARGQVVNACHFGQGRFPFPGRHIFDSFLH